MELALLGLRTVGDVGLCVSSAQAENFLREDPRVARVDQLPAEDAPGEGLSNAIGKCENAAHWVGFSLLATGFTPWPSRFSRTPRAIRTPPLLAMPLPATSKPAAPLHATPDPTYGVPNRVLPQPA